MKAPLCLDCEAPALGLVCLEHLAERQARDGEGWYLQLLRDAGASPGLHGVPLEPDPQDEPDGQLSLLRELLYDEG